MQYKYTLAVKGMARQSDFPNILVLQILVYIVRNSLRYV